MIGREVGEAATSHATTNLISGFVYISKEIIMTALPSCPRRSK